MKDPTIFIVTALCLLVCGHSQAFNYEEIKVPYQAQVHNSSGSLVSDGSYAVVFSIWDDSTGGSMLWTETRNLQTSSGLFSTNLGAVNPIPLDVIQPPGCDTLMSGCPERWLQIEFDGTLIEPRVRLAAAPYSAVAGRLSGDVSSSPGTLNLQHLGGESRIDLSATDSSSDLRLNYGGGGSGGSAEISASSGYTFLAITNISTDGKKGITGGASDTGSSINFIRQDFGQIQPHPHLSLSSDDDGGHIVFFGDAEDTAMTFELDSFFDIDYRIDYKPSGLTLSDPTTGPLTSLAPHEITLHRPSAATDEPDADLSMNADSTGSSMLMVDSFFDIVYNLDFQPQSGLRLSSSDNDSAAYAMNKAEIIDVVASDTHVARLEPDKLVISNIGSSGEDGVELRRDAGGGGRVIIKKQQAGQSEPTELFSLGYSSPADPLFMAAKPIDALPTDEPSLTLQMYTLDGPTETFISPSSGSSDSAAISPSGLRSWSIPHVLEASGSTGLKLTDESTMQVQYRGHPDRGPDCRGNLPPGPESGNNGRSWHANTDFQTYG